MYRYNVLFVTGTDGERVHYLQEVREQLDEQVWKLLDEELELMHSCESSSYIPKPSLFSPV